MDIKKGKPVKLDGINAEELKVWVNQENDRKAAIKCQLLISLYNGISMAQVCETFNVTRETVRLWRNTVSEGGPQGLVDKSYSGRKSQLTSAITRKLKSTLSRPPYKIGYKKPRWTGKLMVEYLGNEHGIEISERTAQLWIKNIKR